LKDLKKEDKMNWQLELNAHWPHDRCAIGWEYIGSSEKEKITTFTVFLLVFTISFHIIES
tara:strand:+ start:3791 stop:3970 length:180 start_codon:yes stop_codon:yes gene_type:complete